MSPTTVILDNLDVEIIGRYELSPCIQTPVKGQIYLVAIPPFTKRDRTLLVERMRVVEEAVKPADPQAAQFVKMKNERGGHVWVRVTQIFAHA